MLRLSVKSATCILILGMLALSLYSADEKESLNSEIYASERKATEIFIEARMVRTPAGNLTVKLNDTKGFKNMDELFRDTSEVETIIEFPRLTTFSGIEAENQVTRDIYYIADATVEENGDITCKVKKTKIGLSFKALPKISEEDPNIITVECELEMNSFEKRAAPPIPAIAGIKEFESLWCPIIDTRKIETAVRVGSGQTIVLSGISKVQGIVTSGGTDDNKYEDILELIFLTVKKGETRVMEGSPKRVKAITLEKQ